MMAVCRVLCGVVVAIFLVSEPWDRHPRGVGSLAAARGGASMDSTLRIERLELVGGRSDGLDLPVEQ